MGICGCGWEPQIRARVVTFVLRFCFCCWVIRSSSGLPQTSPYNGEMDKLAGVVTAVCKCPLSEGSPSYGFLSLSLTRRLRRAYWCGSLMALLVLHIPYCIPGSSPIHWGPWGGGECSGVTDLISFSLALRWAGDNAMVFYIMAASVVQLIAAGGLYRGRGAPVTAHTTVWDVCGARHRVGCGSSTKANGYLDPHAFLPLPTPHLSPQA